MAKGLAVISGSNTVMFKALETGIITAGTISGSTLKPATFTLTGSLLLSGAAEPVLQLQGLTLTATSSVANDTILIKNGSFVREATVLSGNQVVLVDGTNIETKINELEANLGAQTLTVSGAEGTFAVDLESDELAIVGTANEATVALTDAGTKTTFTVGLPDAVTITDSLTITGGSGDKLVITQGNLDVQNGAISGSGKLEIGGEITGSSNLKILGSGSIGGDLSVDGNLTVTGEVTVLDTTNLRIEDPIIILGSGSAGSADGDKGLIFARAGTDHRAFIWDDNTDKFILGSTNNDGTGTDLTVDASTAAKSTLVVHTLQATDVSGTNGNFTGNVTLGDAGTDIITINGYITGSGNIVVSSSLTIGAANNVANETTTFVSKIRMPVFSVSGTYAVSDYPQVPSDYTSNASAYAGHNFYLTSSNTGSGGIPGDLGDDNWAQGNKWYFNERGVWHASFFFSE
jgi:hypothetical protein